MKRACGSALAVVLALACHEQPVATDPSPERLQTLTEAYAVLDSDPAAGAALLAEAGAGPILERARQEAWCFALERSDATSEHWLEYLGAHPDEDLAVRATLSLAEALVAEGDLEAAAAVLINAPASGRARADLELLDVANESIAAAAAHRLAVTAPHLLRNRSRRLEAEALASFDHDDWIARARSWRTAGLGSQGAAELRSRRARGDQEKERRRELARCELDAGSSTRALNALPSRKTADPEDLILRAEAYRRQGWGRSPDRSSVRSFLTCLEEAEQAATATADDDRRHALMLVLECGTESGRLSRAQAAWRLLEAAGWRHPRRGWLGRRLGVALAQAGVESETSAGMGTAIPQHERCFRFWRSVSPLDTDAMWELASVPVHDLYGSWARRLVDTDALPVGYTAPDPIRAADDTPAVAWLLDHAGPHEASAEWQRLFDRRDPTRSEAMAAAIQARVAGRANTAIRSLRRGFPAIGSTGIAVVPSNAARAYLPLLYEEHILSAARATGLEPWLIAAVARQESTFVATARSPAGARGVLQLLPSTARLHARALGLGSRPNLEDPAVNIALGARELAALVKRYGAVEPALAAYNAGQRRVRKWWRAWPEPHIFTESIPIPETYSYVRRVVFLADAYRQIHADAWKEAP